MSDTLTTVRSNGLGIIPPMHSPYGNAFEIEYVPLSDIYTDEKSFQNRLDKYSERSVNGIVSAVENGTFKWHVFDPVLLWRNPSDNKLYVLSGHSRTEAFRRISKENPTLTIDGLNFNAIPSKIFNGSFEDAKQLALNSNALATPETLAERAAYYRKIRKAQSITKGSELRALKEKALRENNGSMIWDLSFLPEGGISFDSLKAFKLGEQSGSTENFLRLATICQWIGKVFQIYKGLSKAHDRELFNFLMSGGYGSRAGQYFSFAALNDRLQKLYEKNVQRLDKVNANGEFTEPFQIAAFRHTDKELDEIAKLQKEVNLAKRELMDGIKHVREAKLPPYIEGKENPKFWNFLRGLYYQWINAQIELWKIADPKEAKQVPSLFGLLGMEDGLGKTSDTSIPTKTDVKLMQRRWNRWSNDQIRWGKFIDALQTLIAPRDLFSQSFKTLVIYPVSNDAKIFDNISQALDYVFDKGYRNGHSWLIFNDKDKVILTEKNIPKTLDGILEGLFGLGKPTIKLEFEDNAELLNFQNAIRNALPYESEPMQVNAQGEFEPLSGHTVNDKPAAVFNCPESQLDCRGYRPTYKRLADYSHLIDAADGAKTLKGSGFDKSTLEELLNACRKYRQVERLAAHLKDPNKMQSAFNIWHWLHTNINYNYDTPGEEEIRTPARVWADRYSGVDCDCLAVFTACLLLNMGYQPKFEIVAFNNSKKFSHIYVNLDGAAIDRVLPVFLARPQNITKTKIMEIPVYELSGVGLCDTSLSGVYSSTLQKIQSGTASGDENNDFRKVQVLVTLKGIDDAAAKLAALLMPHVATVGDDGKYYFDSNKIATLAKKFDAQLKSLKMQGADDAMLQIWINQVSAELQNADSVADGEDTIVVIINPKGDLTNVTGKMVAADLPTLSPMTQNAVEQSNAAASETSQTLPAVMQTTAAPSVTTLPIPSSESGNEDNNKWLWIVGIGGFFAGLGIAAMSGRT